MRNVLGELPTEQHAQVRSLLRAAYKLERAKRESPRWRRWPSGWSGLSFGGAQLARGVGGNVHDSTGWGYRRACIVAWRRPI